MVDDQLGFDDETARRLEAMYQTPDVLRRRNLACAALSAQPGERILDVGCGPGFYVSDLVPAVGPTGAIVGLDSSEAMLSVARRRCGGATSVEFREGSATAIPAGDAEFDAALSVQVYEYVDDIPLALSEIRRVIRPGGRVVIWDTDWTTVTWHSSDDEQMRRVLAEWDAHLRHPSVPRLLAAQMRDAGFTDVDVTGHNWTNTELIPEAISASLIGLITNFVAPRIGSEIVDAWESDLRGLSDAGQYFFSYTQFCFTARRSG